MIFVLLQEFVLVDLIDGEIQYVWFDIYDLSYIFAIKRWKEENRKFSNRFLDAYCRKQYIPQ